MLSFSAGARRIAQLRASLRNSRVSPARVSRVVVHVSIASGARNRRSWSSLRFHFCRSNTRATACQTSIAHRVLQSWQRISTSTCQRLTHPSSGHPTAYRRWLPLMANVKAPSRVKSNKQRRTEILAHRKARAAKSAVAQANDPRTLEGTEETAPCNPLLLAPFNSYGVPPFVARGYYADVAFRCAACGRQEVWRATQQKWWYEVAKGNVESRAKLCSACRRAERERRAEARRIHLEGVAKKHGTESAP